MIEIRLYINGKYYDWFKLNYVPRVGEYVSFYYREVDDCVVAFVTKVVTDLETHQVVVNVKLSGGIIPDFTE